MASELIRERVISLDVTVQSYERALANIIGLGKQNTPSYACFSNVHMIIEAQNSVEFQKMVNNANFVFADGMPLVFALRLLYGIKQERIAGMDVIPDLLEMCKSGHLSIFLFGSTQAVLDSFSHYIHTRFTGVRIAGVISPPFRTLTEKENDLIIEQINSSGANLVFVGLGCPKQEKWMAQNSPRIKSCLLGVGGGFEIYGGGIKRAPVWIQNVGLEWAFRLSQEPRRLFRRYASSNAKFIYFFTKQLLQPN